MKRCLFYHCFKITTFVHNNNNNNDLFAQRWLARHGAHTEKSLTNNNNNNNNNNKLVSSSSSIPSIPNNNNNNNFNLMKTKFLTAVEIMNNKQHSVEHQTLRFLQLLLSNTIKSEMDETLNETIKHFLKDENLLKTVFHNKNKTNNKNRKDVLWYDVVQSFIQSSFHPFINIKTVFETVILFCDIIFKNVVNEKNKNEKEKINGRNEIIKIFQVLFVSAKNEQKKQLLKECNVFHCFETYDKKCVQEIKKRNNKNNTIILYAHPIEILFDKHPKIKHKEGLRSAAEWSSLFLSFNPNHHHHENEKVIHSITTTLKKKNTTEKQFFIRHFFHCISRLENNNNNTILKIVFQCLDILSENDNKNKNVFTEKFLLHFFSILNQNKKGRNANRRLFELIQINKHHFPLLRQSLLLLIRKRLENMKNNNNNEESIKMISVLLFFVNQTSFVLQSFQNNNNDNETTEILQKEVEQLFIDFYNYNHQNSFNIVLLLDFLSKESFKNCIPKNNNNNNKWNEIILQSYLQNDIKIFYDDLMTNSDWPINNNFIPKNNENNNNIHFLLPMKTTISLLALLEEQLNQNNNNNKVNALRVLRWIMENHKNKLSFFFFCQNMLRTLELVSDSNNNNNISIGAVQTEIILLSIKENEKIMTSQTVKTEQINSNLLMFFDLLRTEFAIHKSKEKNNRQTIKFKNMIYKIDAQKSFTIARYVLKHIHKTANPNDLPLERLDVLFAAFIMVLHNNNNNNNIFELNANGMEIVTFLETALQQKNHNHNHLEYVVMALTEMRRQYEKNNRSHPYNNSNNDDEGETFPNRELYNKVVKVHAMLTANTNL